MNKGDNKNNSKVLVAELFSPPRFTLEAEKLGKMGLSYDIQQGCDLDNPETQARVSRELDEARPELLVVCPPCRNRGGWEHLNRCYRSPIETARLIRKSRRQVDFCTDQIHRQLRRGGEFMFEHPLPSEVWKDPPMAALKRRFGVKRVDMCAYNLKCPDTAVPIQKATGIMTSRADSSGFHTCPGCPEHRPIEGKLRSGQNVSAFCATYTPQFVKSMLQTIVPECVSQSEKPCLAVDAELDYLVSEAVAQPAAEAAQPVAEQHDPKIMQAIRKLHCNLGHPNVKDLVRILGHSNATSEAIRAAQSFQCDVCQNHVQPAIASQCFARQDITHNGIQREDRTWREISSRLERQQVPCISIVDYATSLHVMAPIFHRETAEVTKGVLCDSWISWAGVPQNLELDPSSSNLSEMLGDYCESMGINVQHIAADSHWQLGKVERHGHWFAKIFERVCDECQPTSAEEFVDCVMQTQVAKNSLISESGASPYQLVFGRNPRVPQDLLQEDTHVAASDAVLADAGYQRSQAVRQAARLAVLQCQDDKALRSALRARPRVQRQFMSGDWVYYWRSQKWHNGVLLKGGRWHGAALILGRIGVNWVVAHRRNLFRCSPEQLRHATQDEQAIAKFDQSELLGIKTLLEKGQFPKSQFVDLVNQEQPAQPEHMMEQVQQGAVARSAGELAAVPVPTQAKPNSAPAEGSSHIDQSTSSMSPNSPEFDAARKQLEAMPRTDAYGPWRQVRHTIKRPPEYLSRPPVMQQDDFSEMMQEMVPTLLDQHLQSIELGNNTGDSGDNHSPRGDSSKREASTEQDGDRPAVRARLSGPDAETSDTLSAELLRKSQEIEVLLAAFLQKRAQKEIKPYGHEPSLQEKIDESKTMEWETLLGKQAIRIWTGQKAKDIRKRQSHRFIGSRFVVVNKHDEEGQRIKSRWCLQGHLDPDFKEKIGSGVCHSPTLHQLSRALVLQILVSKGWMLQLGDIKGAFLEAGALDQKFSPLYAHQPEGGVPGLSPDDVIEVIGNVYGSNDAPFNWWHTFDKEVQAGGWHKSQFDNCLYYLFDKAEGDAEPQLVGILGAHVDDTITGGTGPTYQHAIERLKARFPYRKWRQGNGEFCGVQYSQNPTTMEITYQQKEYAENLRPISLTKERQRNKEAPATEKEIAALRAINGAANWLSSQSRPDLSVQTSFSQQCFPSPKVKDLLFANQLVHRAKQYSNVEITVKRIQWDDLCICFHSDAGFGNAKAYSTQAGYIASFADKELSENKTSQWSPFAWKSYKLPRKVASTLAGEAQAYATAAAVCEWMSLMLAEAKHGAFDLRSSQLWQDSPAPAILVHGMKLRDQVSQVPIVGITDCKSLYDNLISMSSVSKAEDKRVAIDLAIVKQSMVRCNLCIRWCPTGLMLADGLTKDQQDPADLLRSALFLGEYQLNEEASVLEQKKRYRDERRQRQIRQARKEEDDQKRKAENRKFQNSCNLVLNNQGD